MTRLGPETKVFGIGLPRCGGQALQKVMHRLVGPGCVHSPGSRWDMLDSFRSASEVFIYPEVLDERYGGDVLYILNSRAEDAWLESCRSVYHLSAGWNHPIWLHPLEDFERYRSEYLTNRCMLPAERLLAWDVTRVPLWQIPCEFLGVDVPDMEFPNVDRIKRPE